MPPIKEINNTLKWWSNLPYSKMLATTLAFVSLVEWRVIEVKNRTITNAYNKYDSVKSAMFYERISTERHYDEQIQTILKERIVELKEANLRALEVENKTKELSKSINNVRK